MSMSTIEPALGATLKRTHGVVSRGELDRLGVSRMMVETMVMNGRLRRASRGVFVASSAEETDEQRMTLACAVTGGVVCFPTAGKMWQMRGVPRRHEVHVWVPWERRVVAPEGVMVHRSRHLPEGDIVRRDDGIALTAPPRTVFDAAAWVLPGRLESMIEQGLDRGSFTMSTLVAVQRRLRRCGRDGSGRFASVVAAREPWRKAVESNDELRLERAMLRRGFPPLARGHAVRLLDGDVIHPDLGLPDDRFFVEVDHHTWHDGRRDSASDKRRDRKARLAGCHIERVSDLAIEHELADTVEDLWQRWQQIRAANSALGS